MDSHFMNNINLSNFYPSVLGSLAILSIILFILA